MKNGKVLILCSGGVDSGTLLAKMAKENGTANVAALYVKFPHAYLRKELRCVRRLIRYYGIRLYIVKAGFCMDATPGDDYRPARNTVLQSIALSYAERLGYNSIAVGYIDGANNKGDSTPEFVEAFNNLIEAGATEAKIKLIAPFEKYWKEDVVAEGLELGVPYEWTWSCFKGKRKACGHCPACRARLNAFEYNGEWDPIRYV